MERCPVTLHLITFNTASLDGECAAEGKDSGSVIGDIIMSTAFIFPITYLHSNFSVWLSDSMPKAEINKDFAMWQNS